MVEPHHAGSPSGLMEQCPLVDSHPPLPVDMEGRWKMNACTVKPLRFQD